MTLGAKKHQEINSSFRYFPITGYVPCGLGNRSSPVNAVLFISFYVIGCILLGTEETGFKLFLFPPSRLKKIRNRVDYSLSFLMDWAKK